MHSRSLLFLCTFFLLQISLSAQFVFGWTGGYGSPRELNREIYIYNAINGALKKEMPQVHWFQGPVIGFRAGGDGGYVELLYHRKRTLVASEFDSSNVAMRRELKVLYNTWNLGFGYNPNGWGIGTSIDAGRFKGKGRRGPEETIGDQDFKKLWVTNKTRMLGIAVYQLSLAQTVWVERSFGPATLRFYFQFPWMRSQMEVLDYWLFGGQLNYKTYSVDRFVNFGTSLTIKLGKK